MYRVNIKSEKGQEGQCREGQGRQKQVQLRETDGKPLQILHYTCLMHNTTTSVCIPYGRSHMQTCEQSLCSSMHPLCSAGTAKESPRWR